MIANTMMDIEKIEKSRIDQVEWDNLGFGKVFADHMVVVQYHNGQWETPKVRPYGPMHFSPAISALHYGQAIFEGLKAFKNDDGEVFVFRPEKNAVRFNKSAERMCMPPLPDGLFVDAIRQLVEMDHEWIPKGEGESLYIRPHMFAIDEYVGVRPSESYLFVIFTCPVNRYYTGEVKVKIEPKYTRAAKGGTGHAKAAGNYGAALWPTKTAQDDGCNAILWTDAQTHEYLEESGTMNVIFRSGNKIFTPELSDSILDGVTRDSVLQVARDWGFEVEERKISVFELIDLLREGKLDEAFGAGTAATIAPIRTILYQGVEYHLTDTTTWTFTNKIGPYFDRLKRGVEVDDHQWNLRIL
jgi:branched-chain amino acid aminotransferase